MWRRDPWSCLPLLLVTALLPGGHAIEASLVLADCPDGSFSSPVAAGAGNVGRLVLHVRAENEGATACKAEVRITGVTQLGHGTSEIVSDDYPADSCTARPGEECSFWLTLEWTYCGTALGARWHYEVLFDDVSAGFGHVDALMAPVPCE